GEPRGGGAPAPKDKGARVPRAPLLGDLSVRHSVDVDRVPPDVSTRSGDPEEVSLVRALDDRADGHDVAFRDDVLLDVPEVRQGADNGADQAGEVVAALDRAQGSAVPLDVRRHVVRRLVGAVLVERRFDERANDPLVFLQVALSSHLALRCLCSVGAHKAKLGRRIDSWLRADDYFFTGGSRLMTYSP